MASTTRYVVVLPKEMEPAILPIVPEIDVAGIARHLASYMVDKTVPYVPVFIGCGCAKLEVQVCKQLWQMGYTLRHEMFMDCSITSAAFHAIQDYLGSVSAPPGTRAALHCT
jgi:hypothetical protein